MIVRFGPCALDSDRRQLTRNGGPIHLTPKAFDLLVLLVAESGRVVTKKGLHERLWPETFVSDATLASVVKELRRALDDDGSDASIIRTAHGVGYALGAQIERQVARPSDISCWIVVGGRRIPLQNGETLIGRDPAATVRLDIAGVSRRHARILIDGRGAFIEDLGSKNRTTVGEAPLNGQRQLHDGDQLQFGPAVAIFHASASGVSTETVVRPAPGTRSKV